MNRSTIQVLGIALLFFFGFIGLSPYIAQYTSLWDGWSEFSWNVGKTTIMSLNHTSDGASVVVAWNGVWIAALLGELLLIGVHIMTPVRRNRHVITHKA